MADADPAPSPPAAATLPSSPSQRVQFRALGDRIVELNESQSKLLLRLEVLKEDLQIWRLKLDAKVKTCKDELSELKKALNTELEQMTSEFKEQRATLRMQQDDVTVRFNDVVYWFRYPYRCYAGTGTRSVCGAKIQYAPCIKHQFTIQDDPEQTQEPKNLKAADGEKPEAPSLGNS